MSNQQSGRALQFYLTAPYPCSYLEERQARSQVLLAGEAIDDSVYSQLVRLGFRRSGQYIYRPRCDNCAECVPVRIPVADFVANRSQRRTSKRMAHLHARLVPLLYRAEHYELYSRYQLSRHPSGGMKDDSEQQYSQFMLKSEVTSVLAEFRLGSRLVMVSLIDQLDDGLSAVYAFYDPDDEHASYGVYNVLWMVELCREMKLPYVYLGYWINECRKMSYKTRYQPLQAYVDGEWRTFSPPESK